MNIFKNPMKYLKEIRRDIRIENGKEIKGKSMAVVFFTKVCKAGCPMCFFHSKEDSCFVIPEQSEMTKNGFEKFIQFINKLNVEVLELSGGGEPFEKYEYILDTISTADIENLIIVTSGYWANNYGTTHRLVSEILDRIRGREKKINVDLRVSVDKFHISKVGDDKVKNIITAFEHLIKDEDCLRLTFHTFENDETLNIIASDINGEILYDGNNIIFKTSEGYAVEVETAKIFYANLKASFNNLEGIVRARRVFMHDAMNSPSGNFSLYEDKNGALGLDFLINYNGNVTTWGNYQRYNCPNLYIQSPEEILHDISTDVISYSFLHKSFEERYNIVRRVNPKAADRSILINIRDFSGSYLLEENNTELFYAINVMQEYLQNGLIDFTKLRSLSSELQEVIDMSQEEIIEMYKDSDFCIFDQLRSYPFDENIWQDCFNLVELGHYSVTQEQYQKALKFYNEKKSLKKTKESSKIMDEQDRLLNKLCPMNEEALEKVQNLSYGVDNKKHND